MDGDLKAGFVRVAHMRVHFFRVQKLRARDSGCVGSIGVRLEKPSSGRSKRAIGKALQGADLNLFVAKVRHNPRGRIALPIRQRDMSGNPDVQLSAALQSLITPDYVNGCVNTSSGKNAHVL